MAENNLLVKLLLNTQGFDRNLTQSTQQIKQFQDSCRKMGDTVSSFSNGLGINIGTLTKFGTAAGVAATAGKVLSDAFMSSERNADAFRSAMEQSKAAYSQFLTALNTGSWKNFFDNIKSAINDAKELYELLDTAGSTKANNRVAISVLENANAKIKQRLKTEKGITEEQRKQLQFKLKANEDRIIALKAEGTTASRKANYRGMENVIQERYRSITGKNLRREDLDEYINRANKEGQKFFNEQARVYEKYKNMMNDVDYTYDEMGNITSKTPKFNPDKLPYADKVKYALAEAFTEGETDFQKFSEGYANAVDDSTNAINAATKNLTLANKETTTQSVKIDKAAEALKKVAADFDKLADEGILIRNWDNNKIDKLQLDELKHLTAEQKQKLLPILEKYNNSMKALEEFEREGIITEATRRKEELKNSKELRDNMSTVARDGVFRQEGDALTKYLIPFIREFFSNVAKADEVSKYDSGFTDFYNSVIKKLENGDRDKIMKYFNTLNKPLSEGDYNKTLNALEGLESEYYEIASIIEGYIEDNKGNNQIIEDAKKLLKDVNTEISNIDKELVNATKEKINFLDDRKWSKFRHNLYDDGKNLITLVDSFKSLDEQWKNMDGWDRFKSFISIIESTGKAVYESINAWEDYNNIIKTITASKIVLKGLETTEATTTTAEEVAANTAKIASNKALTASYAELATAGYMAAHAYIPFAGYGIAAGFSETALATIKANGIAGMFANGGIVQGSGSGWSDSIPIRVSNGEMILNRRQQGNLFALLDGNRVSNNSIGGDVKFRLQGRELIGLINNETKKTNKVL